MSSDDVNPGPSPSADQKDRRPDGTFAPGVTPEGAKPFPPGVSGNPAGRKAAGASVKEWWNVMAEWPLDDVRAVMVDAKAPTAKRMAARSIIDACSEERLSNGAPAAGADLDRVLEHTAGKPTQAVDVTSGGQQVKGYFLVSPDDWPAPKPPADADR